ncbi:hypothetical protein ACTQV0_04490 [Selenomonas montiformis]|uniref:hypothetical protein n=1 Tax=Selenomonas montiformis TaxID=2652285 RepID=UPI003F8AB80F
MKKSAKLALALALMMGTTAGVQMLAPNNASAEVSDKFRMELNGVSSYYHDTDHNYYGQTRTDNTGLGKGWNNYTRVQLTYNVDKDVQAVARLHSNYDNAGDFAANKNTSGAYFDQSFIKYNDRKNNLHYIVGKKGMTLGQSMVYNSTGNLTGVQVSYGNWWDPTCFQLTYGDAKGGNRVWSAQLTKSTSKATAINATYVRGETLYNTGKYSLNGSNGNITQATGQIKRETDSFVDFGAKVKFHGVTMVGEWSRNQSNYNQKGKYLNKMAGDRQAWFIEFYTGPTNDFGSGLPVQKVGTHAFSVRWQDVGRYGTYVHNNTFYDGKKGLRLDYGVTVKKGLSVDFVYGRMQAKDNYGYGNSGHKIQKGDWSNIFVAALSYKFR